jgi:Na+/proline symporter
MWYNEKAHLNIWVKIPENKIYRRSKILNWEIVVFIVYLLFMLGIGVFFFFKSKGGGDKSYFLGGRQMGPWVTALSAGASDMSAWVLMGLPT